MQTVAKKKPSPFAVRLRTFREAADVTQAEAAESAGVHIQTYMRWERGGTEPTFSELCALAELFGKTPNDFLPDSE
jgi:transcriptional regulator with XRE-family HTH domain